MLHAMYICTYEEPDPSTCTVRMLDTGKHDCSSRRCTSECTDIPTHTNDPGDGVVTYRMYL